MPSKTRDDMSAASAGAMEQASRCCCRRLRQVVMHHHLAVWLGPREARLRRGEPLTATDAGAERLKAPLAIKRSYGRGAKQTALRLLCPNRTVQRRSSMQGAAVHTGACSAGRKSKGRCCPNRTMRRR